ncbi:MAG: rRNA maturation RNase YbeY [Bacteroidota bacterium]
MAAVNFFYEDIPFSLEYPRKVTKWLSLSIKKEKAKLKELNFIFCSDDYLRTINIEFLNHTTYTDIVTFDNSDGSGFIEGDIFISIDRVTENAEKFKKSFTEELHRVMIHGVLHLIGYSDKKSAAKIEMRKKEDAYLSLWPD